METLKRSFTIFAAHSLREFLKKKHENSNPSFGGSFENVIQTPFASIMNGFLHIRFWRQPPVTDENFFACHFHDICRARPVIGAINKGLRVIFFCSNRIRGFEAFIIEPDGPRGLGDISNRQLPLNCIFLSITFDVDFAENENGYSQNRNIRRPKRKHLLIFINERKFGWRKTGKSEIPGFYFEFLIQQNHQSNGLLPEISVKEITVFDNEPSETTITLQLWLRNGKQPLWFWNEIMQTHLRAIHVHFAPNGEALLHDSFMTLLSDALHKWESGDIQKFGLKIFCALNICNFKQNPRTVSLKFLTSGISTTFRSHESNWIFRSVTRSFGTLGNGGSLVGRFCSGIIALLS